MIREDEIYMCDQRSGCYKKLQLYISRIDCPEQGSIEKICNSSGYDYKSVRVYLTERYM